MSPRSLLGGTQQHLRACLGFPAQGDRNTAPCHTSEPQLLQMPKIWKEYLTFRMRQPWDITNVRHTFDRALRALPITQHEQLWPLYTKFVLDTGVKETAQRVWRYAPGAWLGF